MNKTDMIGRLAHGMGGTKSDAGLVLDALFDPDDGIIAGSLGAGDAVHVTGFGTFEVHIAAARTGRNPSTGEPIQIPAHRRVAFRAGKGLKSRVRG